MKKLLIFCSIILLLILIVPLLPLSGEGRVYSDTIRLHVLANSDSNEDQVLKLEVRDAIIDRVAEMTEYAASRKEAESSIRAGLEEIESLAAELISERGYEYDVKAVIGREYYPERSYNGIHLPEGTYLSLRVLIGEGKGKNWWCVLYPPLCTSSAEPQKELAEAGFTSDQIRVLCEDEEPKYVLRFRILEFFGSLFS